METKNLDIVIPLKEDDANEELRFVLRSIEANMPHRKIFFAGFMPSWAQNVELISVEQPAGVKYDKSAANTRAACLDPRVSDDFILFNDDFFVMKQVERIDPVHRGSLWEFLKIYRNLNSEYRAYYNGIIRAIEILKAHGLKSELRSYELHIPMIFNKAKRLEVYEIQDQWPRNYAALHTNTIYGNMFVKAQVQRKDVKINSLTQAPDPNLDFLSSGDTAWTAGRIGSFIKESFPQPSKFEKDL